MKRMNGFTLIELLIVVAIIGILAAIAVPNFLNAQVRAKVARAESEMRSLKLALETFYLDNSQYPPMNNDKRIMSVLQLNDSDPSDAMIDRAHVQIGNRRSGRKIYLTTPISYIQAIPYDPFRGDGNENAYGYGSNGMSYYILSSFAPDGQDGFGGKRGGFDEKDYTGATLNQLYRAGVRSSDYSMNEFMYQPSNGTISGGDIFAVGP